MKYQETIEAVVDTLTTAPHPYTLSEIVRASNVDANLASITLGRLDRQGVAIRLAPVEAASLGATNVTPHATYWATLENTSRWMRERGRMVVVEASP
jgi:hypothetical protein